MTTEGALHNARERIKELEEGLEKLFVALDATQPFSPDELGKALTTLRKLIGRE